MKNLVAILILCSLFAAPSFAADDSGGGTVADSTSSGNDFSGMSDSTSTSDSSSTSFPGTSDSTSTSFPGTSDSTSTSDSSSSDDGIASPNLDEDDYDENGDIVVGDSTGTDAIAIVTSSKSRLYSEGRSIVVSGSSAGKVRVYSLTGRLVASQSLVNGETRIGSLQNGVYLVRLSDGTKAKVRVNER